jgi:hypothetical protein
MANTSATFPATPPSLKLYANVTPLAPPSSSFPDAPIPLLLAIQPSPSYSPLGRTIFQRVRTAGRVLPTVVTCQRFTPKSCPLSCMPASAAHPGLTIGCACSCSNGPARPRSNICHRRCLTARPSLMQEPQRQQSNWPLLQFKNDRPIHTS